MNAPIKRRLWLGWVMAGLVAGLGAPHPASAQNEKMRVVLGLDDATHLSHLPVVLAQHLGYFKAEGLAVDFVELPEQGLADQAHTGMVAWSLPLFQALQPSHEGDAWQSVVLTGKTPQLALGVSKKTFRSFKSLKNLEGHRVGVMALDSFAQRCVEFMLMQAGVGRDRVTYLPLGNPMNAMQALRNGTVDALCVTDPLMTLLDTRGDVNLVRNLRTVRETTRVFAGSMPGHAVCVPASLVVKHPEICQALANAVVRALKWLRTAGPSDLLHAMPDTAYLPDRWIYLTAIDNLKDSYAADGMLSPEAHTNVWRMFHAIDPKDRVKRKPIAPIYTNEFAARAKKRFNL